MRRGQQLVWVRPGASCIEECPRQLGEPQAVAEDALVVGKPHVVDREAGPRLEACAGRDREVCRPRQEVRQAVQLQRRLMAEGAVGRERLDLVELVLRAGREA